MNIEQTCFGFVGLGLIGGSIAKTIKRLCPTARIIAYNRTFSVAEQALQEGIADIICPQVDETFSQCDYIFLCMPVSRNAEYLKLLAPILKDGCILTDVGSVKSDIHHHVTRLGLEKHFIGGHPMAGSDKTGYEHATSHLLDHARYIITPTAQSDPSAVSEYEDFVRLLGAVPMVMGYEEHDHAAAAISHVPHLIASSLVHLIMESGTEADMMCSIAAGGFRDTTRIASSSPAMWQQICLTNKDNVVAILEQYIDILGHVKELVEHADGNAIYEYLESARNYRNDRFQ